MKKNYKNFVFPEYEIASFRQIDQKRAKISVITDFVLAVNDRLTGFKIDYYNKIKNVTMIIKSILACKESITKKFFYYLIVEVKQEKNDSKKEH